jgi:hypothetical protein
VVTFKAYAEYKLDLNKIDKQSGYPATIEWPIAPADWTSDTSETDRVKIR